MQKKEESFPPINLKDLPAAIAEAMKRQRLEGGGLRREGIKSPMLELAERAVEEMVERKK